MLEKLFNSKYSGFFVIGLHIFFLFSLYFILSFFGLIKGYPTNISLIQWDAGWYSDIVENGYSFVPGVWSNTAFFPLFPIIWRATQLSPLLISILNLIMAMSGMLILKRTLHFNNREFFIFLSIPVLFFNYIPYSEGLFFLSGSILLYGLKRDFSFALLGIFMMGLTRSVSLIFVPIILFSFLFNLQVNKSNSTIFRRSGLLILVSFISLLLAQYIQFLESGFFFTLFDTQATFGRVLSMPELYFTTWDNARLIWIDGLAFFSGAVAFIVCLVLLYRKFRNPKILVSTPLLFSLAYLTIVFLIELFYSPKDELGGTSLMSVNRYIFCTPFFVTFLLMVFKHYRPDIKTILKFLIASVIFWSFFNAWGNLGYMDRFRLPWYTDRFSLPFMISKIYFALVILYSFVFLLLSRKGLQKSLWSGVYIFNLLLQIILFNQFFHSIWIG